MHAALQLGCLNKSSATVAHFHARATNGIISSYSYKDKRKGTTVTVHKFQTTFVGTDSSSYVIASSKGSDEQVKLVAAKFPNDSVWALSKVVFEQVEKQVYISTRLAFRVDLGKTILVPRATESDEDVALRKCLGSVAVPGVCCCAATYGS